MLLIKQHNKIHELIRDRNTDELLEIKHQAMNMLRAEKALRDLNTSNTLPHKEIEKLIEIVVKVEAYEFKMGWLARTKRRLALTKEFSL